MKTFEYRGYDAAGHVSRGLVEALTMKDAREKLANEGVLADKLSVTGRTIRFRSEKRSLVYRELSALLGAGMPLLPALGILIDSPELGDCRVLLAGVRDGVREGVSLAAALSSASASVTPFEVAIIEAAEQSATVELMLESLAEFIDEQERLRERIQGALIYPAIVFTVGVCVSIVMLGLLVPRASDMLSGSKATLPWLTRFMIGFGRFALSWGLLLLGATVVGVLSLWRRMRTDKEFGLAVNRRMFGVPVLGRALGILANLRFAQTLGILLRGGVSLIDGFVLAGRSTGSAWVQSLAEKEAESVRHGSSLSDAVKRIPPLAVSLPGWLRIGEASGGLVRLLESASKRYQQMWDRYVGRCLAFLEPILILLIGGFVLMVTLSVLLPVISLSQSVAN